MVDIQSKEVIDKISEDLKVQPALQIPRKLGKEIQLTYDCNPEPLILVKSASANNATTATIHTTSSDKDTFLLGFSMTVSKDVVSDSTQSRIVATSLTGGDLGIFNINYQPLTAESFTKNMFLPIPMQLKRGTTITINNTTATASIKTIGNVFFYEKDPQ